MSKKPLILIGDSKFAEIAYEYFTYDSDYQVVAFSVERAFITKSNFMGLPVVPFEDLPHLYKCDDHSFFAAMVYTQQNTLRKRMYDAAKRQGYIPASYISSKAFVWRNCSIGEHCFIFENNTIQPFTSIGDNVIIWSGNHIGHHTQIGHHNFIASHVVISGNCTIGDFNFFGVNATTVNDLVIGHHNVIAAGALVRKNVESYQTIIGNHDIKVPKPSKLA
jgi:sugar O-acyltransferase (sialic acid O-acetyltransferase NeuD family)